MSLKSIDFPLLKAPIMVHLTYKALKNLASAFKGLLRGAILELFWVYFGAILKAKGLVMLASSCA